MNPGNPSQHHAQSFHPITNSTLQTSKLVGDTQNVDKDW